MSDQSILLSTGAVRTGGCAYPEPREEWVRWGAFQYQPGPRSRRRFFVRRRLDATSATVLTSADPPQRWSRSWSSAAPTSLPVCFVPSMDCRGGAEGEVWRLVIDSDQAAD